jgi:hypothetical protein
MGEARRLDGRQQKSLLKMNRLAEKRKLTVRSEEMDLLGFRP